MKRLVWSAIPMAAFVSMGGKAWSGPSPAEASSETIHTIDSPGKEFFPKALLFRGIPIKAPSIVADEAVYAASNRLSLRTWGLGGLLTSCGEENLLKLEKDRYRAR